MSRLEALADPIRLRVVRELAARPGMSLRELAEAAGVHANTARSHVAALEEAGAIEREPSTPSGRGRPRQGYRLAPDWSPPTADFRGLAELLAAAVLRGAPSPAELRAVGVEWGRYLQGRPGGHDVASDLPFALERLGFESRVDGSVLRLTSCPCTLVLPDRPQLVCELAAAVAEGVLAGSGSGLEIGERSHDPERRSCSLALVRGRRPGAPRTRGRIGRPLRRSRADDAG
jgi:DNA-binding transcriptional ArsR family regulator